ncbi:Mov34/MPN/PAD-1 family protein [Planktothrix mougeotii]|uniref:Mov34/MPN/PAD-1 family protein n=1 Tax=Planktothrix mougeotii LEGE 06226 TaxID=1828728 RepID=A0ABR9UG30_9CYAN|nr:Mov34/MPN/PAD-1 family protein [Planktothrix mougeotii]MBE9145432.1 Mov34/MPN/PAD-1 family protein [Planktothrix mougeotii LEGE 06226]
MLYITTSVIDDIERDIARYQPERGGALLGIVGKPIITHFILDSQGITSGASYLPSPQLTQQVQRLELTQGLELKGVIHSHPGGLDRPSGPDEEAILEGLNINSHLEYFIAPIVTLIQPWGYSNHELKLANGKISFYAGYRQRNRVTIEPIKVQEISDQELNRLHTSLPTTPSQIPTVSLEIQQELTQISYDFGINKTPEFFITNLEGHPIPAGKIILKNGTELLFLFSLSHPVHAPRLLVTFPETDTQEISLPWLMSTPSQARLRVAIKSLKDVIEGQEKSRQETETQGKLASEEIIEEKNNIGSSECSESSLAKA